MLDQMKMIAKMKKAQKELANQIIEVEAGDGMVLVRITGEQKIKEIKFDPDLIDLDNIQELERYTKQAVSEAIIKSQQVAAEKMKPLMGGLGF